MKSCQVAIERARRVKSSIGDVTVPSTTDRVNRVIMFMENYSDREDVLIPGLDAVIAFVNNRKNC